MGDADEHADANASESAAMQAKGVGPSFMSGGLSTPMLRRNMTFGYTGNKPLILLANKYAAARQLDPSAARWAQVETPVLTNTNLARSVPAGFSARHREAGKSLDVGSDALEALSRELAGHR